MPTLYELGEALYRFREKQKSKAAEKRLAKQLKKNPPKTGAEEQRELERIAMIQQQAARDSMALEDVRSMAVETKIRQYNILLRARQNDLESRRLKLEEEKKAQEFLSEDGFQLRFERDPKLTKWREGTEMFEKFSVGPGLTSFQVLSEDDGLEYPIPASVIALQRRGVEYDLTMVTCRDGTVRLCAFDVQSKTAKIHVCARSLNGSPVHGAIYIPATISPIQDVGVVLYGCGDGSIRCGWNTWHNVYKYLNDQRESGPELDGSPDEEDMQATLLRTQWEGGSHHTDVVYGLLRYGSIIFSWSGDGTIKKWCLETGALLFTYLGHRGGVATCLISSDGKYLLSGGDTTDASVRLWDATQTEDTMPVLAPPEVVQKGDREVVEQKETEWYSSCCSDCDYAIREHLANEELANNAWYQERQFCKTPELVVSRSMGRKSKLLMQTKYERATQAREETAKKLKVVESRDKRIAESAYERFPTHHGGSIRLFHSHNRNGSTFSHMDWVNHVCLNPANDLAASGSSDRSAKVWTFPKGELVNSFESDDWILSCAISNISHHGDGKIRALVTCSANSILTIWDIDNGTKFQTLRGHFDSVTSGQFLSSVARFGKNDSSDYIRTCSLDGTIRTWKLGSGLPLAPEPPQVVQVFENTMTIRFKMPIQNGANVRSFHIQARENETSHFIPICVYKVDPTKKTSTFKERVANLTPGRTYEFRIAAKSKRGMGEFSTPSPPRRCLPSVPGIPEAPIILRVTASGADISWLSPDSMGAHIKEFVVRYRGGLKSKNFEDSPILVVPWKEGKLRAEQEVKAIEERLAALEAAPTGAKEALRARREADRDSKLMRKREVLYSAAKGCFTTEGSEYKEFPSKRKCTRENFVEVACHVSGLEAGMAYQFSVAGINKVGQGEFSSPSCSEMTNTRAPDQIPTAPYVVGVSVSSITIKWDPAQPNGASINAYTIRYGPARVVDELLEQLELEHASAEQSNQIFENDRVKELDQHLKKTLKSITPEQIVAVKSARNLNEDDLRVLQVLVLMMRHFSHEEDLVPGGSELSTNPLPPRTEIDYAMRHARHFIGRLASFRLRTRDRELALSTRPAIQPIDLVYCCLVKDLAPESKLVLPVCKALRTWLRLVVEFDKEIYKEQIFEHLEQATQAWERHNAIENELTKSNITVGPEFSIYEIGNLQAGRPYRFQVRGANSHGPAPFSIPSEYLYVKRGCPSEPLNVRLQNPTPLGLEVTWDPPETTNGAEVLSYQLYMRQDQSGVYIHALQVPAHERRVKFDTFQRNTYYEFVVVAENQMGPSKKSKPSLPVSTLPSLVPLPPASYPTVLDIKPDSAVLNWDAPGFDGGEPIHSYHVMIQYPQDKAPKRCASIFDVEAVGPYSTTVRSEIHPGKAVFSIVAENSVGCSDPSPPTPATTIPTTFEYYID